MARSGPIVGSRAPRFDLPCTKPAGSDRDRAAIDDYEDRWLVLLFYPRDFSLVCPTELTALSNRLEEFRRRECEILGVSTDSIETHERWIATPRNQGGLGGLQFPLAADENGEASQAYGVYIPKQRIALRGLFIIDPNGVLQYQVVHNLSVGRRSEEVLRVLDGLQSGGMCSEGWSTGDAVLDPTKTLGPNSVMGQYRIEEQLGVGTFGSVYRAHDTTLDRKVALKVLRPDSSTHANTILNEARTAAALNHPNVCAIYSVDASEGVPMIVMEHLDGEPLAKRLEAGPLPSAEAARYGKQIADGMAAAHAHNVVHGDLKPGNIMITRDGQAKVMDFGLARKQSPTPQVVETAVWEPDTIAGITGTPSYMSPEQARGETPGPASDVFALGLILYEMLTGRRAIPGDNVLQVIRSIDHVDGERLAAELPPPFAEAVRHSLIQNTAHRRTTMARMAELLT